MHRREKNQGTTEGSRIYVILVEELMRILQVVSSWKGGTVRVAFDVARVLSRRGHKVTLCTTNLRSENRDLNEGGIGRVLDFYSLCPMVTKKMKVYITPQLFSLARKIRSFDIVHLHGYRTFQNVVMYYYAKKYGIPYVLQACGSLPRMMAMRRLKWIYDMFFGYRLLRDASKVIALSQGEAEQYRSMGVQEDKIEAIPNGINLLEYSKLPPKGSFKKKFSIDNNEKIILFLGRIHRIKGVDILVKAFASIERKLENVKLVIVGPDDGHLHEVRTLAERLRIGDKVAFVGPLFGVNKLEVYVDADFLVVPSLYEIFGIVILEAYACGKPVIASSVMGPKELVLDGETGILVNPREINELTDAIELLLYDESRTKNMGMKAKQFVAENFDIEKVVNKIEKLYKETL